MTIYKNDSVSSAKVNLYVPTLIIHGGAGSALKDAKRAERIRNKMTDFLSSSYEKLMQSNALEAVVHAVQLMEDDPDFNAGTGSHLQSDGEARLSASLMDGRHERFAGVINIQKIKNPILVARALLDEKDRVLAGKGAFRFAENKGFHASDPRTPDAIARWKKGHRTGTDTVGGCALDADGYLASATSTGGKGMEMPGRVSDSAMPVACFAGRQYAISSSGIGEEIIEEGLAIKIGVRVRDGLSLKDAFVRSFDEVRSNQKQMGAIGVDSNGNIAWDTTTENIIYGWKKGGHIEVF